MTQAWSDGAMTRLGSTNRDMAGVEWVRTCESVLGGLWRGAIRNDKAGKAGTVTERHVESGIGGNRQTRCVEAGLRLDRAA